MLFQEFVVIKQIFSSFNWTFFGTLTLILFWFDLFCFILFGFWVILVFLLEDTNKFIRFFCEFFTLSRTWKCQIKHLFYFIAEMYQCAHTPRTTVCHTNSTKKGRFQRKQKGKFPGNTRWLLFTFRLCSDFRFYWFNTHTDESGERKTFKYCSSVGLRWKIFFYVLALSVRVWMCVSVRVFLQSEFSIWCTLCSLYAL